MKIGLHLFEILKYSSFQNIFLKKKPRESFQSREPRVRERSKKMAVVITLIESSGEISRGQTVSAAFMSQVPWCHREWLPFSNEGRA